MASAIDKETPPPFKRGDLVISYRVGVKNGVFPVVVMVNEVNGGVFSGMIIHSDSQPDVGRYETRWTRCEFTMYDGMVEAWNEL